MDGERLGAGITDTITIGIITTIVIGIFKNSDSDSGYTYSQFEICHPTNRKV